MNGGTPNRWFIREKTIKMDDLGVPPFQETSICFQHLRRYAPDTTACTQAFGAFTWKSRLAEQVTMPFESWKSNPKITIRKEDKICSRVQKCSSFFFLTTFWLFNCQLSKTTFFIIELNGTWFPQQAAKFGIENNFLVVPYHPTTLQSQLCKPRGFTMHPMVSC